MELIKLLFVFVVMIVLLMRRTNLGVVMTGISLLLGLLFQLDLVTIVNVIVKTFTGFSTLNLIVAVTLMMVMEEILREEGVLQRMVGGLRGLVGDQRIVLAALPALVGLIPSTGGAIFSAPMVEEVSRDSRATAEQKAFINLLGTGTSGSVTRRSTPRSCWLSNSSNSPWRASFSLLPLPIPHDT